VPGDRGCLHRIDVGDAGGIGRQRRRWRRRRRRGRSFVSFRWFQEFRRRRWWPVGAVFFRKIEFRPLTLSAIRIRSTIEPGSERGSIAVGTLATIRFAIPTLSFAVTALCLAVAAEQSPRQFRAGCFSKSNLAFATQGQSIRLAFIAQS
jgi:hypothetical protein